MAQSYFPARAASPVNDVSHDSVFGGVNGDKQLKVEDVQEAYIEQKDRYVFITKPTIRHV
jgi:mitofusin